MPDEYFEVELQLFNLASCTTYGENQRGQRNRKGKRAKEEMQNIQKA